MLTPRTLLALAASTAAEPEPSIWATVGKVATILGASILAFVLFAGKATLGRLWLWAFDDCADTVKSRLDKIYEPERVMLTETHAIASEYSRRLTELEDTVRRQGDAHTSALANAIAAQTLTMKESLGELRDAVTAIHEESAANASAVANVLGFLEAREGKQAPPTAPLRPRLKRGGRRKGDR